MSKLFRSGASRLPYAIIAGLLILGALVGLVVSKASSSDYRASTTRYITVDGAKTPDQLVAMNTLLSSRAQSYMGLVTSSAVLQPVIDQLHLDTTTTDLASHVTTEVAPETLLLTISATDPDPQRAVQIVNAVAAQAAAYIPKVENFSTVGASVRLVEVDKATTPTAATSPNTLIDVLVGAVLGGLLGYLLAALLLGRRSKVRRAGEPGRELPRDDSEEQGASAPGRRSVVR